MVESFQQLAEQLRGKARPVLAVAAADDGDLLGTICEAKKRGIADAILVGKAEGIKEKLRSLGLTEGFEILDEPDLRAAAMISAKLVGTGKADILMKGLLPSGEFLKAVLHDGNGMRGEGLLCHLAAFEIPGWSRLLFITDGGMNIAPSLSEKAKIIELSTAFLRRLGIKMPKVAVLAATEEENPKMPNSVAAGELRRMNERGAFPGCIVEGPIAMDVALSGEAAMHKGIKSAVSGEADLLVTPDMEAGNMIGKALMYCAKAKMAGLILGAEAPVIMTSRADSGADKINAVLLAAASFTQKELA